MIRALEPDKVPMTADVSGPFVCSESVIPGHDATEIFVRHYLPNGGSDPRTLFIVHGMSEHGERYDHVAQVAAARGWNVLISDLRGHGRSGGVPTHVSDFGQYVDDLTSVSRHFDLKPHSTAILGHSMGGLVTARWLQRDPQAAAAAVLTSPLLGMSVPISRFTIALGKAASLVYPQTRFKSRVDQSFTTRNAEVLQRRAVDPYNRRSVTAGWYFAMEAALKSAWSEATRILCPLLLMQAGNDRIVDPNAARPWFDSIASVDKSYYLFPEHYHELLNEPDWRQTAGSMMDWLDLRVGPQAHPRNIATQTA
ncbi:MAG: lysophospholipase [Planctomycetaceae bacterium]